MYSAIYVIYWKACRISITVTILNYWKHIFPGLRHCQKAADSGNIDENKKCMF